MPIMAGLVSIQQVGSVEALRTAVTLMWPSILMALEMAVEVVSSLVRSATEVTAMGRPRTTSTDASVGGRAGLGGGRRAAVRGFRLVGCTGIVCRRRATVGDGIAKDVHGDARQRRLLETERSNDSPSAMQRPTRYSEVPTALELGGGEVWLCCGCEGERLRWGGLTAL